MPIWFQTPACLLAYDSVIIRHKDRELGKDRGIWQNLVSRLRLKVTVKREPRPGVLSTQMSPSIILAMLRVIAIPRPVP